MFKIVFSVAVVFTIVFFTDLVDGQTSNNVKDILSTIFTTNGYNKNIRSRLNQSLTTSVGVSFNLLSINDVNEVAETMRTSGYLKVTWKDEFFTWNPSSYGGIQFILYPQNTIWKPDISLKNSFNDYKELGTPELNVFIDHDGTITWTPIQVFKSTCSIDITYFPFDTQACSLIFSATSYSKQELRIIASNSLLTFEDYEPNSGWDIIGSRTDIQEDEVDTFVVFQIRIKRKPQYFILTSVLPVIMLSILSVFVFLLPCDSGEKASYAITVFLALAVFLTIVTSSMPDNSENTSIFAVYILLQALQSTLSTIVTLILIRLNSFEAGRPVPKWLAQLCRLQTKKGNKVQTTKWADEQENGKTVSENTETLKEGTNLELDWRTVVNRLDQLLFIVFLATAFLSTLICLVLCST